MVVADAFGFEGADGFAVDAHGDFVALCGDEECVPFAEADFRGEALVLREEQGLVLGGEGRRDGLFPLVDVVLEIAGLAVADVHGGGAHGDADDVAGVGAFVVLVVEPDVEALGLFAHEFEFHGDLDVALGIEFHVVHGVVVGAFRGDADEDAVLHDAAAFIVSPARAEAAAGEVVGENGARVVAGEGDGGGE